MTFSKRKLFIAITLAAVFLLPVSLALSDGMPNSDQSLAKMLWGHTGVDVWEHRFSGADTLSYAFIFVTPDSSDTLDATAAVITFTSTVYCSLITYADSSFWIDTDWQRIKAGESKTLPARTRWIHVETSGAGLIRTTAFAD